jgi:hypothetical protein
MPQSPRLKFRNKPTTLGGLRFSSRAEAKRYGELLLLERAGAITNIVCQPVVPLIINGMIIGRYIGDFSYNQDSALIIEDVKSPATRTPLYRLKKKLVKALHNIDIVEIESKTTRTMPVKCKRISQS